MYRKIAGMVFVAVVAVGCQQKNGQQSSREPMIPPGGKFDAVKEPEINAQTRYAAGQLAESRGDWSRAAAQYEAALKLDPRHAGANSRLPVAYSMSEQPEKAIAAARKNVKTSDGAPEAWNNLAQCFEYANQPPEAEAAYLSGIQADPNNRLCRVNYGLLLCRTDRVEEGREQMLVVLSPAEVHYNVASVLEIRGKKEEARAEYRRALAADPTLTDAKKRLAKIE